MNLLSYNRMIIKYNMFPNNYIYIENIFEAETTFLNAHVSYR